MGSQRKRLKKRAPPKERNWTAVRSFLRGGAGSHKNRDEDVRKGRSRKIKHKNRPPE